MGEVEVGAVSGGTPRLSGRVGIYVISTNPVLNFNLGSFFFCSKAFPRIMFSIIFREFN